MTEYAKYLRKTETPWCPGCGNGIVLKAICDAIEACKWEKKDIACWSGIGCSGRMSSLMDVYSFHELHGRALPSAEAMARLHPDKHFIIVSGDGDGGSIGRSAFVQECIENVGNMTYIIVNNFTYALTKGQASPTTPLGTKAYMCPFGVYTRPFDLCNLAIASGATFVARETTLDVLPLSKKIEAGFKHHGFAFIEALSACPENFGRKNGLRTSQDTRKWIESIAISETKFKTLSDEEKIGKYPTGILKRELGVLEGNDAYALHVEDARRLSGGE
jgi:2-oxoglutarate ferredoxin oxidoreductase subunit beta